MQKLIFTAAMLACTGLVYAQRYPSAYRWNRNTVNLRLGPEIGFAAGDFGNTHNLGTGATVLFDIPLSTKVSVLFQSGYISFSGDRLPASNDVKYRRTSVVPLRTGVNYRLTPDLYAGVQLGQATVRHLGNSTSGFSQSLGVGYFRNRLDLGVRWDRHYVHGGLSSINIKAAYVLRLSRSYR